MIFTANFVSNELCPGFQTSRSKRALSGTAVAVLVTVTLGVTVLTNVTVRVRVQDDVGVSVRLAVTVDRGVRLALGVSVGLGLVETEGDIV